MAAIVPLDFKMSQFEIFFNVLVPLLLLTTFQGLLPPWKKLLPLLGKISLDIHGHDRSTVAQMEEQATRDQKVLGLIPAWIQ